MRTIYVVFLYHAMLYETAFLELCWYHNSFEIRTSRKLSLVNIEKITCSEKYSIRIRIVNTSTSTNSMLGM